MDLIRWFFKGNPKIEPSSQSVSIVEEVREVEPVTAPVKKSESPTFDFLKENSAQRLLEDLQSIRPVTRQFDLAREELLKELKRLAPPKRRTLDIFKDAA
jgi:hypothetical protein